MGLPVQTAVNTRLRGKLGGNPFYAARYSFTTSMLLMFIILGVSGIGYAMPWTELSAEPAWIWAGGFCGIYFLTCSTILMPHLGSVQTVIFQIVGQVIMSLVIDHFGLFRSQFHSITIMRILGAAMVLAGAVIISILKGQSGSGSAKAEVKSGGLGLWPLRLLDVTVGFAAATQTAVNARLGSLLGTPLKATTVSFVIGTACIWIVCLIVRLRSGRPETAPGYKPWWMWTGGTYGIIYNLSGILLAQRFGTGMAVLIMLTGTISGGVVLEHFGALDVERRPTSILKIGCVLMMLAGLALIRLL